MRAAWLRGLRLTGIALGGGMSVLLAAWIAYPSTTTHIKPPTPVTFNVAHAQRVAEPRPSVIYLPATPENEWAYCGSDVGPCSVDAMVNGDLVTVTLLKD